MLAHGHRRLSSARRSSPLSRPTGTFFVHFRILNFGDKPPIMVFPVFSESPLFATFQDFIEPVFA